MKRLEALDPNAAIDRPKELFDAIKGKMGMVPNMMRTMGNSPAVLEGYLGFTSGLDKASIGNELTQLISLAMATANGCDYCNAAHSFISSKVGISADAIDQAREGYSSDPKIQAALTFAKKVLLFKGKVSDSAIQNIRDAGYSEDAISEIVAVVALNIFTNYYNNVAETEIDFPKHLPII